MKFKLMAIAVLCFSFVGCAGVLTPDQVQQFQEVAVQSDAAADEIEGMANVAATQPGKESEAKALKKAAEIARKVAIGTNTAAESAAKPGATGNQVVTDTALAFIPEPWRSLAGLGIGAAGLLIGWIKTRQANKNTASVTNAVAAGLSSGKLVASTGATAIVDHAVNGHHATDAIVDVIASHGGGPAPTPNA